MGCPDGKGKGYEGKGKGKSKGSKSKGTKSKGKDGSKGKSKGSKGYNKGYYSKGKDGSKGKGKDGSKGTKGYYNKGYYSKSKGTSTRNDGDHDYDDPEYDERYQNETSASFDMSEAFRSGNFTDDDIVDIDIDNSEDLGVDVDRSKEEGEDEDDESILIQLRHLQGVEAGDEKESSSSWGLKVFTPHISVFSLRTSANDATNSFECTKTFFGCRDDEMNCEKREGCGKNVPEGFYPDLTTPIAYCYCPPHSNSKTEETPARYETCDFGLVWDNHAVARDDTDAAVAYLPGAFGSNGLLGTDGGACVEVSHLSSDGHLVPTVLTESS